MRFFISILLLYSVFVSASPNNFSQAKIIAAQLFQQHSETIYCRCAYLNKEVHLASCNMQSADLIKRAHRIEWEHIMAAEHFGKAFDCWNKPLCEHKGKYYKGRACCGQIDPNYRHMESELYNLWPEVGVVNQARSNYRFVSDIDSEGFYGCELKLDKKLHQVVPPDAAKGIVARAYLFMAYHYTIPLSGDEYDLFMRWHKQFPPTPWEITWANQVADIEGYINPYILIEGQGA